MTVAHPRYALNLWLWRRIMRTRPARDDVVALLDAVFAPKPENAAHAQADVRYVLRP